MGQVGIRQSLVALIAMGFGLTLPAYAQPSPEINCHLGCPIGAPDTNKLIAREIYALSNNPDTKFADWLAYRVQLSLLTGPSRRRNWKKDPNLDANETLFPNEYADASVALHVDRGHQAPLGSFKGSDDFAQTNFLSNITPQFTKLNQGAWKKLEDAIRQLARDHITAKIFVMTGPLYEWPMAKLPATNKHHEVPSAYWKIVALVEDSATKVSAFYFYQDTPKRADYCDHAESVDFIERKSGFDFFSAMPDADEDRLESTNPTLVRELGC